MTSSIVKAFRAVGLVLCVGALGCGGAGQFRVPDAVPDDRRDIPAPKKSKVYLIADAFDQQVSRQARRRFDLSHVIRKIGGKPKEAFNFDAFDGVRDSSWFTNRNGKRPLTLEEIRRGPNAGPGPDTSGKWTVVEAKNEGITPGFTIEDSRGRRYVVKFDPPGYSELTTGAEVVSTKLIYAAGYNTPENFVTYFHPDLLQLGENVELREAGRKRVMTTGDIDRILERVDRRPDGRIRAVASKFLEGKVLGPFRYEGLRKDDPNDFIPHEHRRELRGLRVISAWLNHYDTKASNSLDSYVEEDGRRYVRHYLIDFGSTLGSRGNEPMSPWTGHENFFDGRSIVTNTYKLGLHVPSWEKKNTQILYSSVGLFRSEPFAPMQYKFSIPNPAFDNMTDRDGYWAAKIAMSFTNAQIKAAVETGDYSNPDAAAYLTRILIERRDIVGRYWFNRVNCLDRFAVDGGAGNARLRFTDIAVKTGIASGEHRRYQYQIFRSGTALGEPVDMTAVRAIALPAANDGILEIRLRHRFDDGKWAKWLSAYVQGSSGTEGYALLATVRQN